MELEAELRREFPRVALVVAHDELRRYTEPLLAYLDGGDWPELPADIRATAFQLRVWRELRAIAAGATATYGGLAAALGRPNAARAVARACASNPVALVVPRHRVVPASGDEIGGYRWGANRKRALLALERDRNANRSRVP